MARKKRNIALREYYHVYSRTILSVPAFKDRKNANRLKLIFLIANSTVSSNIFKYIGSTKNWSMQRVFDMLSKGERLTDVLCDVIMPTHYHLLLKEIEEGGIQMFLHTSNTAIAKYAKARNPRKGHFFEGRYNAKHIKNNTYLLHLSRYIHLNPLDILIGKEWRKGKLRNWKGVRDDLINYPWSSIRFYTEGEKDSILSGNDVITSQFKNNKEYETFLQDWSDDSFDFIKDFIED